MPLDLAALRSRLPASPLTRFAPSPTGRLHLGHVVHAVFVWGLARALGGRVLLRIEDHDRERSRAEHEAGILDDLAWLGLAADLVVPRQSDRGAEYRSALRSLDAEELVYACRCTRREIEQAGGIGDELRYPGTCRDAGLPHDEGLGLRVRLDEAPEAFEDARLGPQVQVPALQCGDLLVRDRVGQWTYQFAVAVDDTFQGVDLVIRGEDLLQSTGRQIALSRLLGRRRPPVFLHHPLVYGESGLKLSKANRDAGLDALRAGGWPPAAVLGLAAARAGLLPSPRPLAPRHLADLFTTGDQAPGSGPPPSGIAPGNEARGTAPGTAAPGSAPRTDARRTAPGTAAPGTAAPGTAPGTAAAGSAPRTDARRTAPGTAAPGTAPGTEARGTARGTEARGTARGTEARGTAPGTRHQS